MNIRKSQVYKSKRSRVFHKNLAETQELIKSVSKNQCCLVMSVDASDDLGLQPFNGFPVGSVMYRSFGDIDALAAFIPEAVNLTQLHCQPFACNSMTLHFEPIRFNFNHVNCRLRAVGDKCSGVLTFTWLMSGQGQSVISNNLSITEDYVWGFDPHRGADMVFPGNSTHCAVHIRQDVFEACAQAMDRLDLNAKFLEQNHVYMPESLPPLRNYLDQLYELLRQRSPLLQNFNFQQIILQDFLPLLIMALPIQHGQRQSPGKVMRRSRLVKQAHDYMQTHIDQTLTLADLCQALGTSSRALCYGFQEMFGTSPIAYLKILRLQSAYRTLKLTEAGTTTITAIAAQFGFYHLGYFARDYKQMFGELPSETLNG